MPKTIQKKKKTSNRIIFAAIAVILGGMFFIIRNNSFANIKIPETLTTKDDSTLWWDSHYAYRRLIQPKEGSSSQSITVNHAQLVIDGKSNSDASDLKVIAFDKLTFYEVPAKIYNNDSLATKIEFDSSLAKGDKYYLYYGNKIPDKKSVLGTTKSNNKTLEALLNEEEKPDVILSPQKKWVLKEKDSQDIILRVENNVDSKENLQYYVVLNDSNILQRIDVQNNEVKISSKQFNIGLNKIFLVEEAGGNVYRSNTINFYLTSPVYVAWTIDWEGVDPQQKFLDKMEDISNKYSINMTHFYNPRIYIYIKATEQRKRELSRWIKARYEKGDDIAMHLHMQHDMVTEAGVKAKDTMIGWDGGEAGYDLPSTVYNHDEYLKILNWGITELKDGLKKYADFDVPEIQGFRAGGWFANLDTLKAMEDAGFLYDSSGRIPFKIGKGTYSYQWTLTNKNQPYYPSVSNQNTDTPPNMGILEIPDNGADSYWSDAKSLKDNFYANYSPGSTLDKDILVVFLSHPDWFNIDEPKLNELYSEISKYRNDLDLGPVKFVTLREYLQKSESLSNLKTKI